MKKHSTLSLLQVYKYKKETHQSFFSEICMAPHTNLLFVPSGKVMACHYNRGIILGDIRNNSIKEIWNGPVLKKLRKILSKKDFSYGCQSCLNDLNVKNYFLAGNYKYMHTKKNLDGFPSYFDFQLENTCNLKCVMCSSEYSSALQGKAVAENPYRESFFNQLAEFIPHLDSSSFTGGEPLVIKSYYEIWKMFNYLNPSAPLYISTNASHISPALNEILEKGNFHFTVSIDSLDSAVYESIRVNADFEKTMKNIDYLSS